MKIEINSTLTECEMHVRKTVFTDEQGLVDVPDEVDEIATHFVLKDKEGNAIGVLRVFTNENGEYVLGRLAVLKQYRKQGLGKMLLNSAEKHVKENGGTQLLLHSQLEAAGFYASCGYSQKTKPDKVQGVMHVWMEKNL